MLAKQMDEVFDEISKPREEAPLDDGPANQAQRKKNTQYVKKIGQFILHPESQLKMRFEGIPHQLYGEFSNRPDGRSFDNLFDFQNTLSTVRLALGKCEEGILQILEAYPQRSPTMILCLQNAYYKAAIEHLCNFNEPKLEGLEERELFDDSLSLCNSLCIFQDDIG